MKTLNGNFVKNLTIGISCFFLGGGTAWFVKDYLSLKKELKEQKVLSNNQKPKIKKETSNDPFHQMNKWSKKMDDIFNNGFKSQSLFSGFGPFGDFGFNTQGVKIEESEDDHFTYIKLKSKGLDKNSINIEVKEGMVSISGKTKNQEKSRKDNFWSNSYSSSSFSRAFSLPNGILEDKVEIETNENEIVIKIPKFS